MANKTINQLTASTVTLDLNDQTVLYSTLEGSGEKATRKASFSKIIQDLDLANKTYVDNNTSGISTLQSNVSTLQSNVNTLSSTISTLSNTISSFDTQIQTIDTQIEALPFTEKTASGNSELLLGQVGQSPFYFRLQGSTINMYSGSHGENVLWWIHSIIDENDEEVFSSNQLDWSEEEVSTPYGFTYYRNVYTGQNPFFPEPGKTYTVDGSVGPGSYNREATATGNYAPAHLELDSIAVPVGEGLNTTDQKINVNPFPVFSATSSSTINPTTANSWYHAATISLPQGYFHILKISSPETHGTTIGFGYSGSSSDSPSTYHIEDKCISYFEGIDTTNISSDVNDYKIFIMRKPNSGSADIDTKITIKVISLKTVDDPLPLSQVAATFNY